jgi:hypothetical protein
MNYNYKIFYNLESKANKDNTKLLYFNMSYGFKIYNVKKGKYDYKNLRFSTQCSFLSEYWDNETKRLNAYGIRIKGSGINNTIGKIEDLTVFHYNQFCNGYGRKPTPDELKKLIFIDLERVKKENNDILIVDYISKLITKKTSLPTTSKEHWKNGTKVQYENLKRLIDIYEKETNISLTFGNITEEDYWNFFDVINDLYYKEHKVYYTITNMSKFSKQFKTIFNSAVNDEIKIGFNHNKQSIKIHPAEASSEIFLTEKQLQKIINENVSNSPSFVEARNYLIISSFTGLRIEDMTHLHETNIETHVHNNINYEYFITKIRKATYTGNTLEVAIPILKPVRDLLSKNENKFPSFSSQQSIRLNIKAFLKHLEFNDNVSVKTHFFLPKNTLVNNSPVFKQQHQLFTPHDCRSTFITNLLNLPIPESIIEPITHPKVKKESMMKLYNKSNIIEKMILFVTELNKKGSELYKY